MGLFDELLAQKEAEQQPREDVRAAIDVLADLAARGEISYEKAKLAADALEVSNSSASSAPRVIRTNSENFNAKGSSGAQA